MPFVCNDPDAVQRFFGYMKSEIASALNRLRGCSGPVWQGRTDTPVAIDADKVIIARVPKEQT